MFLVCSKSCLSGFHTRCADGSLGDWCEFNDVEVSLEVSWDKVASSRGCLYFFNRRHPRQHSIPLPADYTIMATVDPPPPSPLPAKCTVTCPQASVPDSSSPPRSSSIAACFCSRPWPPPAHAAPPTIPTSSASNSALQPEAADFLKACDSSSSSCLPPIEDPPAYIAASQLAAHSAPPSTMNRASSVPHPAPLAPPPAKPTRARRQCPAASSFSGLRPLQGPSTSAHRPTTGSKPAACQYQNGPEPNIGCIATPAIIDCQLQSPTVASSAVEKPRPTRSKPTTQKASSASKPLKEMASKLLQRRQHSGVSLSHKAASYVRVNSCVSSTVKF